jgi:hypothetical protein
VAEDIELPSLYTKSLEVNIGSVAPEGQLLDKAEPAVSAGVEPVRERNVEQPALRSLRLSDELVETGGVRHVIIAQPWRTSSLL